MPEADIDNALSSKSQTFHDKAEEEIVDAELGSNCDTEKKFASHISESVDIEIAETGMFLSEQKYSDQSETVLEFSHTETEVDKNTDNVEPNITDTDILEVISKQQTVDSEQALNLSVPAVQLPDAEKIELESMTNTHESSTKQTETRVQQPIAEFVSHKLINMEIKHIVEAALFASGSAMSVSRLLRVFDENEKPERSEIRAALTILQQDYADKAVQLVEVAGGFRFQVKADYAAWVARLFEERPPRYSRALLETLSIIAYRQPVTRGDIENIRGVSVSTQIIQTLQEREWVKVVGHKEVPGKPALFATTSEFLDYFNLKSLTDLPQLSDFTIPDEITEQSANTSIQDQQKQQTEEGQND